METALIIYFAGMFLTMLIVSMTPSPPPSKKEWAFMLLIWPLTLLAFMAMGTRR